MARHARNEGLEDVGTKVLHVQKGLNLITDKSLSVGTWSEGARCVFAHHG